MEAGSATIGLSPAVFCSGCMMMTKKLGDNDSLAVDLLLDRSMNKNGRDIVNSFVSPIGDDVVRSVGAVETLLRLVSEMPAEEVPAGLAARTVERVRLHAEQHSTAAARSEQQLSIGQGPQHA